MVVKMTPLPSQLHSTCIVNKGKNDSNFICVKGTCFVTGIKASLNLFLVSFQAVFSLSCAARLDVRQVYTSCKGNIWKI